jgi:hypothetical protein
MSNNPPPYGPPPGSGQPYGQPPAPPYGQQPAPPYGQQPAGYPGAPGQPVYGTPYGAPGQGAFGAPPGGRPSKRWYQRWWVWLVFVIALIIIGFVIFAVLRGNKYALESKIESVLKSQNHQVSNVNCPDNIDTDKGHSYNCTATVDGATRTIHVSFIQDKTFLIS